LPAPWQLPCTSNCWGRANVRVAPIDFGIPKALPFYRVLGVIGYFVPRVLGVGYDTISDILNSQLALKLLLIVMIAKAAVLVISLGSGTSGGLLAPRFTSSAASGVCLRWR